ncbi:Translin [Ophiocordyceps sinensis CO18]|uniref:Translin n=1 Tax=Ophiocordyceps sinensis (strain Co18 / CGMCC 3.14243) TaxID=911162 RepID=T5ALI2_OPHSC|nr:Translin [Ophiocordyceps sinensis CO18]
MARGGRRSHGRGRALLSAPLPARPRFLMLAEGRLQYVFRCLSASAPPPPSVCLLTSGGNPAPTNLKDRDAFHLTIEEYLLALIDLTQDLSRLATNAVTHGDFDLPMVISAFVKDLFAGFQLLNLKNDILRKRADAVKYDVKRVEDVVYDLSLRGLVARPGAGDADMKTGDADMKTGDADMKTED